MDETYLPVESGQERTTADFLLHLISEREADIRILSKPDSWKAMAFEAAGTRQQAVDLITQEVEALRALDPATVTEHEVREISRTYQDRLNDLAKT